MNRENYSVTLSDIDEERFGIKTAKVWEIKPGGIEEVLRFCQDNNVKFIIARCRTNELNLAREMEEMGFQLMDTLIYYLCNLRKNPLPEYVSEIVVRPFRAGEENIIRSISAEAFEGYLGHYHTDTRLDRAKCDEVYADWAYKSCFFKEVADEVFIAEYRGKIIGFGAVRANITGEGEYILAGILNEYQGHGAFRMITINCMRWCIERGINTIITSTNITNLASQKVQIRLGFDPSYSYYIFHKWVDR